MKVAMISMLWALSLGVCSASRFFPRGWNLSGHRIEGRTWDKDGNEIGPAPVSTTLPVYIVTVDPNKDKTSGTHTSSVLSSVTSIPDKDKRSSSSGAYTFITFDPSKDKEKTSPAPTSTIVDPNKDKDKILPTSIVVDPYKDKDKTTATIVGGHDKDKTTGTTSHTIASSSVDPNKDKVITSFVHQHIDDKDKTKTLLTKTIPASTEVITMPSGTAGSSLVVTKTISAYVVVTIFYFETAPPTSLPHTLFSGSGVLTAPLPTYVQDKDKDKVYVDPSGSKSLSHPSYYPSYAKDKIAPTATATLPHIEFYTPAPWPNASLMPMWKPEANGNAYGGGWACVPLQYLSTASPAPTGTGTYPHDKDKIVMMSGTTYKSHLLPTPSNNHTVVKGTLKPRTDGMRNSSARSVRPALGLAVIGMLVAVVLL